MTPREDGGLPGRHVHDVRGEHANQLALGIAITLAVIAAARLNPLRVLESIHPILILLVLMGVVNLFVVRTGTPVVALGPLSITDQGVTIAVLYACRFALVIILGAVFLTTTTPTAMTDALPP